MKTFKKIVKELTKRNETIAAMESCTGGGVANAITSVDGASVVLKYSAVTYCNEYKIKMGVSEEVIDKYSVYSIETAHEMAFNIAEYAKANIGVGITGKLNKVDKNNDYGKDNQAFVSIYYKNEYYDMVINVNKKSKVQNKNIIIENVINKLEELLWEEGLIR